MEPVNIYEAKTQLAKYVESAESGQDVIIARGGKQDARLTAIKPVKHPIRFGILKGKVRVAADFDAPLPEVADPPVWGVSEPRLSGGWGPPMPGGQAPRLPGGAGRPIRTYTKRGAEVRYGT